MIVSRAIRKSKTFCPTFRAVLPQLSAILCIVCHFMFQMLLESHVLHIHSIPVKKNLCFANVIKYSLITNATPHHSLTDSLLKCLKWCCQLLCHAIHIYDLFQNAIKFWDGSSHLGSRDARVQLLRFIYTECGMPSSPSGPVQQLWHYRLVIGVYLQEDDSLCNS